jgi:hypothetical protein
MRVKTLSLTFIILLGNSRLVLVKGSIEIVTLSGVKTHDPSIVVRSSDDGA